MDQPATQLEVFRDEVVLQRLDVCPHVLERDRGPLGGFLDRAQRRFHWVMKLLGSQLKHRERKKNRAWTRAVKTDVINLDFA